MDNPWYSWQWFAPETFTAFTWEQPLYLFGLVAVPLLLLARWLIRYLTNQKLAVAWVKSDIHPSRAALVRVLPDLVLMAVAALILVALARPQKTNEKVEQWSEGIDIMLALDISQSMQIEDFKPNRLDAAKSVARDFIKGRLQDRIGIVVFAGDAFSLAPLTTDYELLFSYLNDLNFDMIQTAGTAIGSALAVSTNRMRESESNSKVCILISDGDNRGGNIDPITAAELAGAYGIKIYTIIVGKEGLVPFGKDYFGRPQMVENTVDETTMRKIAVIGGGEFFRVEDDRALRSVFDKIDQYEKAEIKESRYRDTTDFYHVYLAWAIAFFLAWLVLKSTFISNVLQD
jgi:Ca-activated chloride channel family protein